jgi:ATP-dependent DNA helicase RecQ
VLHDTSLDEIVRVRPSSISQLLGITGIGERKADLYGQKILAALKRYREGARAQAIPAKKTAPAHETLLLLSQGKSLEEIAQLRGRQLSTIVSTVTTMVEAGAAEFNPAWVDRNKQAVIEAACARIGLEKVDRLRTLKDVLPPEVTYEEIRLVLAKMRREQGRNTADIPA